MQAITDTIIFWLWVVGAPAMIVIGALLILGPQRVWKGLLYGLACVAAGIGLERLRRKTDPFA
jgi:hypothetical protein